MSYTIAARGRYYNMCIFKGEYECISQRVHTVTGEKYEILGFRFILKKKS